ncbi:hypothetical protein EMIHUDRAFT_248262, partial [Emiliania huxleyi CCMP1516]|uniref:Abnormal spindle-like microcephaly-associated protein ASH domain-containing protein n=2 Tax=Emiliania huxleyi TaxID=2903 RepID=A0A0D3IHM8_EMIH1
MDLAEVEAKAKAPAARNAATSLEPVCVPAPLVLSSVATTPTVSFGTIAPRASVTRALAVKNVAPRPQRLEVRGVGRGGLSVQPPLLELPPHGEGELCVTWAPLSHGSIPKRLELLWNRSNTLAAQAHDERMPLSPSRLTNNRASSFSSKPRPRRNSRLGDDLLVFDEGAASLQDAVNRRRMTTLLRGPSLRPVIARLEAEVESGLLCVRPSLNLAADVGQRDNLLSLLGCYNPLWLRLALEAISGEMAPLGAAADDAHALR